MKIRVKTILLFSIATVLILGLIATTSRTHEDRQVNDLFISIEGQDGQYFIEHSEVTALINAENTDYVLGLNLDQLNLQELERRVEANAFVKDAQLYLDIKGNLHVKIKQAKPLARVLQPGGHSTYIDETGELLPLNTRYTARVPIVEFDDKIKWEASVLESDFGFELLSLLKYIEEDPFWKAQIAHVIVDKNEELSFIPQVTRQEVIFGKPSDVTDKFNRLKLFYTEVLPAKGWNTYRVVNVKYSNQIVCK
ncbi:MAG: cell division protein FtsQ/DivIB [Cyclobacteriaceae bacterium]